MKSSIQLIVRLMLLFWLIEKVMSWKPWYANRNFPVVSGITLTPFIHTLLLNLFIAVAVLLLIKPLNKPLQFSLLITEVLCMASDQMRWQPWQYQFMFILFAITINNKNEKQIINSIAFMIAATYFYSGLQKWNSGFLYNTWANLILTRFLHVRGTIAKSRTIYYCGLLIPLFEIITGGALLFTKNNKRIAWLLIAMHCFILSFLGPWGLNFNSIVWPWNVTMILFLYFLFIRNQYSSFNLQSLLYKWNIVIAIAIGLLPIAGLLGYWDAYFSFGLYSGKSVYPTIYFNEFKPIPQELKPYVRYSKKGYDGLHQSLSLNNWSLGELNIPVPPEKRIFKNIYEFFKDKYPELQAKIRYYQ